MLRTKQGAHGAYGSFPKAFGLPILWVAVYVGLVTGAIYLIGYHWAYDDPFITYRYAQNIAHGLGMVYNPAQRVLSTTSPLFAIFLAAGSFLWSDLPHLANLSGAFSLALGGLFLFDLAHAWKTPEVGWVGLILYPANPLLVSTLGSEVPLYLAFCLGAFAFYARKRYLPAAVLSGLAVLTRPDGVLVPVLLGIDYLVRQRDNIPWKAILAFLAITLPWLAFAWIYFGSPLPVTLGAKQHQGSLVISQGFIPGFINLLESYARIWPYWLAAGLCLLGIFTLFAYARRWLLFFSWTLLYFAAYASLGVSSYFWYYAPLVPGFAVAAGLGITILTRTIPGQTPKTAGPPGKLSWKLPGWISRAAAAALLTAIFLAQGKELLQLRSQVNPKVRIYQAAGEWLEANTPPNAAVGTQEVGIIGYYSQRPMVDFAGLIQPEVATQLTPNTTYDDAALWAVQHYHPGYLILQEGGFPVLQQGYARQNCRMIKSLDGKPYRYPGNLDIYACQ